MPLAIRYQDIILSAVGDALDGVLIYVCTQPANTTTIPPSPLAQLYTDSSEATHGPNPVLSDGNGNYNFYIDPGTYTLVYYDTLQRIETIVIPDITIGPGGGGGGGTVTSVGLTAPAEFTVAGSPVTGSGTLAISKANENMLTVWAGPLSGPAAAPTFKLLSDLLTALGVGGGTVTSVAAALSLSSLLSGSVSGSPITTAGTITLTINFANQSANTFLAGPASGATGPVTARRIVPADFPLDVSVAFAGGSPVFDTSLSNAFSLTLTGDANFGTIVNGVAGQVIWIAVVQDGTGGHAFTWPANTRGGVTPDTTANAVTIQGFKLQAGNIWRAVGAGLTTL